MESVSFLSTTNSPLTQFIPHPRKSSCSCSSRLRIACSVRGDPWSLSDGDPNRPKPRSMNPKNPLSDDNARRIIKGKAAYLSRLRRNQGPAARTPLWIKRSPEQMVQHLNDHRHGHLYGRHVVAAISLVRSLSRLPRYDIRSVMVSFAGKLSFREMCVVLKEQKGWRQVQEFFSWMKLQLSYHPSVVAYTIVLRAYGQAGKIELAEQTFLEMLEAGVEPDQVACGTMLCSYARWGRHGPMLSFHSAVRQRGLLLSLPVYNFMLSSLHKKSLHRHVTQLWAHMAEQPLVPNAFTYAVVVGSLFRQADYPAALRAFDEMRAVGIVPEEVTYCHLITLATQSAEWSDALAIYGDMRDQRIAPSSHTCASLLTLFYKTQDYSAALSLFSEMERRKIPADQVIYGLLIRIYGKLGLYDDARKAFEETRQLGILTHEKTYLAMAQVHLNSGDSQKALQVLDLMKSTQIPFSRFGYIVLLQCHVMAKDLTSAESTFQALQSHTGLADAGSCNDMLHLYLGLGLVDKARDFAARIRTDGVVFDEELCKTVIRVYFKEGMVNDAKQLVEEMSATESLANNTFIQTISSQSKGDRRSVVGDQPDTVALGFVISMHLAEGNVNETEKVLRELLDTSGGALVASQLVNNFIREGDALKAETVMNQLRKLGCRSDDATVAYVINMYGKQQKLKQAEQVFLGFADSAAAKMTLCKSMLDVYVKCGKPDEAYSLYQKVSAEAGQSLDAVAISIVVNALSNTGKHREAETMIRKALEDHAELDTVAYNTFLKAMLHAGRLHFAASIYEHMLSLDVTPSIQTYNTMISVYGRGRKLDKATEVFNSACEAGLRVDEKAYMNLISHYGKGGKRREASLLFSEMLEKGIKPGMVSYNIMMNVFGIGGFHEEAEKLVKGMERDGHVPDSLTYLSLIRAYTESHKYSEAEATIDSMCEKGVTASSAHYNVLISALAKAGLMEEAERVYERVVLEDGALNCCRSMVRGYLDYGHVQRGIEFIEGLSAEEDRFIMSSAVHFYNSAGMEDKAAVVLESMRQLRMSFLDNLKVGSKLSR